MASATTASRWSRPSSKTAFSTTADNTVRLETRAAYNPLLAAIFVLLPILFVAGGIIQYVLRRDDGVEENRKNSELLLALYVPMGLVIGAMYLTVLPKAFRLYQDELLEVENWMGCVFFSIKVKEIKKISTCAVVKGCVCKLTTACSDSLMLTAKEPRCGCISKLLISPQDPDEFMRAVQDVIDLEEQT